MASPCVAQRKARFQFAERSQTYAKFVQARAKKVLLSICRVQPNLCKGNAMETKIKIIKRF